MILWGLAIIAHQILLAKRNFSTKIKVCKENKAILLMRDFNHRNIDQNLLYSDPCSKRLPDIIQDLFLTQHKKKSTRGYIILDLVLNLIHAWLETLVNEQFGTSNNCIIHFELVVKQVPLEWKEERFQYTRGNFDGKRRFVFNTDQTFMCSEGMGVEESWL